MITFDVRESFYHEGATLEEMEAAHAEADAYNREQEALGKVAVWREGDTLFLRYQGRTVTYRGSAVEGCGASDELVQKLAADHKTEVEAAMPKEAR